MKRPVLVLGRTGILGHAVTTELTRRGIPFLAPSRAELDLEATDALRAWIEAHPVAAVINVAAFTDVGAAERPESLAAATRLNETLPATLAHLCARSARPLTHISTDYVFDGAKASPYREDDPVHPIQVYGRTKLAGEQAVLAAHPGALVLRVSTLYGPGRPQKPAYVDAIFRQAREKAAAGGGDLSVVEHPVSSPTYAPDVAPALLDLMDARATGLVHVVNDGAASRRDLALRTVALAGFADRVAVRTRPEPAGSLARPMYSVLATDRLAAAIGRKLPRWDDALARYIESTKAKGER